MNILAVFAHPDDETVLAGGLLALLAKSGHSVFFLTFTRGEGGEVGEPALCLQEELGNIREKELKQAVKLLGGKQVICMDFIDPVVGADNQLFSFSDDLPLLSEIIKSELGEKNIQVVVSHGINGEYGHPGHITVFQAVKQAVYQTSPSVAWYTVQANYPNPLKPHLINRDDEADWIVDVSSVAAEKLSATAAHQSQHALFIRRKSKELGYKVNLKEILLLEESYRFQNKNGVDVLKNILSQLGYLKNG